MQFAEFEQILNHYSTYHGTWQGKTNLLQFVSKFKFIIVFCIFHVSVLKEIKLLLGLDAAYVSYKLCDL